MLKNLAKKLRYLFLMENPLYDVTEFEVEEEDEFFLFIVGVSYKGGIDMDIDGIYFILRKIEKDFENFSNRYKISKNYEIQESEGSAGQIIFFGINIDFDSKQEFKITMPNYK